MDRRALLRLQLASTNSLGDDGDVSTSLSSSGSGSTGSSPCAKSPRSEADTDVAVLLPRLYGHQAAGQQQRRHQSQTAASSDNAPFAALEGRAVAASPGTIVVPAAAAATGRARAPLQIDVSAVPCPSRTRAHFGVARESAAEAMPESPPELGDAFAMSSFSLQSPSRAPTAAAATPPLDGGGAHRGSPLARGSGREFYPGPPSNKGSSTGSSGGFAERLRCITRLHHRSSSDDDDANGAHFGDSQGGTHSKAACHHPVLPHSGSARHRTQQAPLLTPLTIAVDAFDDQPTAPSTTPSAVLSGEGSCGIFPGWQGQATTTRHLHQHHHHRQRGQCTQRNSTQQRRRGARDAVDTLIPGLLFIGGVRAARNEAALGDLGITAFLNVACDVAMPEHVVRRAPGAGTLLPAELAAAVVAAGGECGGSGLAEYLHLPLRDRGDELLAAHFRAAFGFIRACAAARRRVLLFCREGKSRSGAMAIAFVMDELRLSYNAALDYVRERRQAVDPNLSFCSQLSNPSKVAEKTLLEVAAALDVDIQEDEDEEHDEEEELEEEDGEMAQESRDDE